MSTPTPDDRARAKELLSHIDRSTLDVAVDLLVDLLTASPLRRAWDAATMEERRELVRLVLELPLDGPEIGGIPVAETPWGIGQYARELVVSPHAPNPFVQASGKDRRIVIGPDGKISGSLE